MTTFPTHPDQLTRDWLSARLDRAVSEFAVEFLGEGAGLLAWVTRLRLTCDDDGPETVIAKFPSPSPENRAVATGFDMYQREVEFYRDIAPSVAIRSPRCFHADLDPENADFVLLLEDLGHLRIGDQVAGCTLEEAKALLRALASLHASSWRGRGLPDVVSQNNEKQIAGMAGGFSAGWPVVLEQFGDLVPDTARGLGDRMPDAVGRLLAEMCVEPICVSHADVRLDNIFFDDARLTAGPDEPAVALVDWQSVCTSSPEQDVAYFLTQSVPREVLAKEDLVAYYHGELTSHGVDYDLEDCRARYRVSALYLLNYAVTIAGTLDLQNDRGIALARTLLGNSLAALEELDAFGLV